jgi:uncharacterized membrane protein
VGIREYDLCWLCWMGTVTIHHSEGLRMKLAGLFLLPAGWAIVTSALVLFAQAGPRSIFVLAGLCIEAAGLVLILRASRSPGELPE